MLLTVLSFDLLRGARDLRGAGDLHGAGSADGRDPDGSGPDGADGRGPCGIYASGGLPVVVK